MKRHIRYSATPVLIVTVLATVVWLNAGSLTPPVGPLAGTMKTLAEIEPRTPISSLPYTISQMGSYYLTGNLTGTAGFDGITISSDNVAIDLKGFTMTGPASVSSGIVVSGSRTNIAVRDGTIRGWQVYGIDAQNASATRFDNLCITSNGLSIPGIAGLYVGENCLVSNCMLIGNHGYGLHFGNGVIIKNCIAANNDNHGITGIDRYMIEGTISRGNLAGGFDLDQQGLITNCVAQGNSGVGIRVDGGVGSLVVGNCSKGNGTDFVYPTCTTHYNH